MFTEKEKFENRVLSAVLEHGYDVRLKPLVGKKLGGAPYRVDFVAVDEATHHEYAVDLLWQAQSGTAEEKVPFLALSLQNIVASSDTVHRGFLVLGGHGWRLKDFFTSGQLHQHMPAPNVGILSEEEFCELAMNSALEGTE